MSTQSTLPNAGEKIPAERFSHTIAHVTVAIKCSLCLKAIKTFSLSALAQAPAVELKMSSTIVKKIISTSLFPRPVGPYNQAVIVDRTVYLSGVVGLDKDTGKLVPGGVVAETVKVMDNIKGLLRVAGSHIDNVIKCTVLLSDINDYDAVNREYGKGSCCVWVEIPKRITNPALLGFQSFHRIIPCEPATRLEICPSGLR